ncbi:MAG: hypothetical protein AAGE43_01610 [Pseudomonadota bacterium]
MSDPRDDVAAAFRLAAEKLDRAAAHCRIAAQHYSNREIPRGCAHAFAALGDMRIAENAIDDNAMLHAGKARIDLDPGAD